MIRSLAIGAIGAGFVALCPATWRVRVRLAVPVVVFGVLLALSFGFFRPLPQMEVRAPAFVADFTALPVGWASPLIIGIFWAGGAFLLCANGRGRIFHPSDCPPVAAGSWPFVACVVG